MVYLFLAPGFEEVEALSPLDILRRANVEVITVGIGGRQITGSHGITVLADTDDEHLPAGEAEAVILPGGMPGSKNLDASAVVDAVLADAAKRGALLAAICAAPFLLGKRGYLKGKRATCYPGFEKDLAGAVLRAGTYLTRDGNVITAAGMGVAQAFGLEIVAYLKDRNTADRIKAGIMTPQD